MTAPTQKKKKRKKSQTTDPLKRRMKIVTYNVNGLRPRVSQFGSLRKLLDSFDADIICFQETKLSRQELRADLVQAEGYESFFSCTRTSEKGRTGYSGVATFCRVKSAFASEEVALPVSAEEGFTGVYSRTSEYQPIKEGLGDFSIDDLLKIDGEGRCIITDHEHFVLFNVYGPRAECTDAERIQFKSKFFNVLQKRWESLLDQGRRIFVVGDLNIAPSAIDRCDAAPDFEKNEFRTWFRSLLVRNGGSFCDVFRENHPERRDAYTCWPTNSGAEVFNFGSRIDHILCAGPCLHKEENQGHTLLNCHVKECDILEQFKRWKPGNAPRHKDTKARHVKLEGSDHAPVCMSLTGIPDIQQHNPPSLSTRYCLQVYGCQQTLVSMLARRQSDEDVNFSGESNSHKEDAGAVQRCIQLPKRPLETSSPSSDLLSQGGFCSLDECSQEYKDSSSDSPHHEIDHTKSLSLVVFKKQARETQMTQLSLKSFFQKRSGISGNSMNFRADKSTQADISTPDCESNEIPSESVEQSATNECQSKQSASGQEEEIHQPSRREKNDVALAEWQRIQQHMQTSIPLCKGHKEPCVSRVVKKSGQNSGRRFYVCARAEVFWDLLPILKRTVVFSNGLPWVQRTKDDFDGQ
ncbi:DNA-(apurinic or apyrimidinic site) endonuclease 2 isoform X2 [Andrographis paniculata]|uniref:DNA-(apurinic or apyrimidinic site) endonuclease 2 isoform X2 n=1 Tax=Andrographis paniculata TaxID=175694 RepID=UPI0021E8D77A|nr:DNA-(apurinic or apyrimidinic site) endonuclease 2 isoform X2 [Andrographis paniculata]